MNGKRALLERILNKGTKSREENEMNLEPEKMERILSEVLAKKSTDFMLPDSKDSKEKLKRSITSAQEVTRVDAIRGSSLKLDPLNELHYYVRGVDYMKDKLDYAVQDFTRAIQINDTFALAYFARGNVYIMLLEYAKNRVCPFPHAVPFHMTFPSKCRRRANHFSKSRIQGFSKYPATSFSRHHFQEKDRTHQSFNFLHEFISESRVSLSILPSLSFSV